MQMLLTDEEEKRIDFLTAYEELGPGGLTEDEQDELETLRDAQAGNKIFVLDCAIPDTELGDRLQDILDKLRYMTTHP